MPTVSKTQFKAQALQYFRQVEQTGQEVVITDRGRPVVDKYLKLRENDGERLCGRPGVRRNQQELDDLLAKTADNWSLGRMAATDRNVLRLGAYEILFTETPARVAINEAVELAKRFGSANSAPFVNGILDKFIPRKADEAST